jgi:hypothetical protein
MTLHDNEFLNDAVINFYLKHLERQLKANHPEFRKKVHIFNTFFFTQLTKDGVSKPKIEEVYRKSLKRWTKDVDIFEKDYLIVPVNQSAHWYLLVACFPWMPESAFEAKLTKIGGPEIKEGGVIHGSDDEDCGGGGGGAGGGEAVGGDGGKSADVHVPPPPPTPICAAVKQARNGLSDSDAANEASHPADELEDPLTDELLQTNRSEGENGHCSGDGDDSTAVAAENGNSDGDGDGVGGNIAAIRTNYMSKNASTCDGGTTFADNAGAAEQEIGSGTADTNGNGDGEIESSDSDAGITVGDRCDSKSGPQEAVAAAVEEHVEEVAPEGGSGPLTLDSLPWDDDYDKTAFDAHQPEIGPHEREFGPRECEASTRPRRTRSTSAANPSSAWQGAGANDSPSPELSTSPSTKRKKKRKRLKGATEMAEQRPVLLSMDSLGSSRQGPLRTLKRYLEVLWEDKVAQSRTEVKKEEPSDHEAPLPPTATAATRPPALLPKDVAEITKMKLVQLKIPQQDNGWDCGVHMLHTIETLLDKQRFPNLSNSGLLQGLTDEWDHDMGIKRIQIDALISEKETEVNAANDEAKAVADSKKTHEQDEARRQATKERESTHLNMAESISLAYGGGGGGGGASDGEDDPDFQAAIRASQGQEVSLGGGNGRSDGGEAWGQGGAALHSDNEICFNPDIVASMSKEALVEYADSDDSACDDVHETTIDPHANSHAYSHANPATVNLTGCASAGEEAQSAEAQSATGCYSPEVVFETDEDDMGKSDQDQVEFGVGDESYQDEADVIISGVEQLIYPEHHHGAAESAP